ncbi:MAG: carbohydrate porin [Verrucomicrobiae bacterium]|nr:carbohydrate porin [Verrucomicrobiae bacterium]
MTFKNYFPLRNLLGAGLLLASGASFLEAEEAPAEKKKIHFLTSSLDETRTAAGIDRMDGVRPLVGGAPLETKPFDLLAPALPLKEYPRDPLAADPMKPILRPIRNCGLFLKDHAGMQFDFRNATLYQMASEAMSHCREDGGCNRMLVRLDQKLWDLQGAGVGKMVTQFSHYEAVGSGAEEGIQVGSDVTLDALWGQPGRTKLCYLRLEQGILDDRIRFVAGKMNPNNYILNSPFIGDEDTQFLAGPFDGCTALPRGFQGYLPGVAALTTPMAGLYANLVATSPLGGKERDTGFQTVGDGLWWFAAEAGLATSFLGEDRPGKLGVAFNRTNCGTNTTDEDTAVCGNAFAATAIQHLTPDLGVWLQYASTERELSSTVREISAGVSLDKPFGRRGDGWGIAMGSSEPADASLPVQTTMETYYRIQLTQSIQLTPDLQLVMNPSYADGDNKTIVVGGLRLLVRF